MMNQCRACEHCIVIKSEDDCMVDSFDCDFFLNRAEIDFYEHCDFFEKIKDKSEYIESYLSCDECDYRKMCSCIDVTNIYDEKDHFFDLKGNYCYLENAGLEEFEDDDDD